MSLRLSAADAKALGITGGRFHVSRPSKYGAVKTDGFDSRKEADRFWELSAWKLVGEIVDLRRQPEFHCWVNGRLVCKYRADFYYIVAVGPSKGHVIIEDVKGFRTPAYRQKKKLVEAIFGIEIVET